MSESTVENVLVLGHQQVMQKLRRIAYQIYENNVQEEELLLAGIKGQGYEIAGILTNMLSEISPFRLKLIEVSIDKRAVKESVVVLDCAEEALDQKTIILIDDVLSTGTTLAYSLKPFLKASIARLEIAVLINRAHLRFPIRANYTGMELATTLQNHISVEREDKEFSVYLR